MDDRVAAVTVAVASYRRRKRRIKDINQLAALVLGMLDEEGAIVSREHICGVCNVRRAAITPSVQIVRCCWRPLAQYYLRGTLRPSSYIHVVVQAARND